MTINSKNNKIDLPEDYDLIKDKLKHFHILENEANTVRENDKILIRNDNELLLAS